MPRSSSLYEVRSQGSTALPRKRQWCDPKRVEALQRCLIFSWFTFSFITVGIVLLLATKRVPEGNWDKLIYLVVGGYFLNLIWWVSWFRWVFEPGFGDIEANADGAAVTTAEARTSGSPDPATHMSFDFEDHATPIGHSLASLQGSRRVPKTARSSFSSLSQAFSSTSLGSRGAGWISRFRLQSRAVGSWMAKHLRSHGSRMAVQPLVRAPQAAQKPVPSARRAPVGPCLLSCHALPRPQPSPAIWSRMPTLSTTGCPPCLLPVHYHSSLQLPQLFTGQSLQAALRCPPREPVQGHPPTAQSPALAWPGGPRPLRLPSLQPRPETTVPEPHPSLRPTAGNHADAPVLHASSSEGTTVRKILVQSQMPGQVQQLQGPDSPGTNAREPRDSHLCPIDC